MILSSVLPAHAEMIPGGNLHLSGGEGAPRSRGDDPVIRQAIRLSQRVLPAHAGMILAGLYSYRRKDSAPRSRGDDPL